MRHTELIERIAKATGRIPKQKELADILAKPLGTINSRASRDLKYDYEELEKIQDYYRINFSNQDYIDDMNDSSGEILADYYPEVLASCGNGTFEMSQNKEKMRIPTMSINDYSPTAKYTVINAYGESMNPTIHKGDKLIVEMLNCNVIRDNEIYIFFYNDRIFCKRLIQNIDSIVVISDNSNKEIYPTNTIKGNDMNNVRLIGRIAGLMRGL